MHHLKPLLDHATKQEIQEALASVPAPALKKIAKALNVKMPGGKFLRIQEIFDKNTIPRIVNVYNTFVAYRKGRLNLLKTSLKISTNLFADFMPIFDLLIHTNGKINVQEIVSFIKTNIEKNKTEKK